MASAAETGRFELGRVFGRTFQALSNNLVLYLGLSALLVGVPTLLFGFAMPGALGENPLDAANASPLPQFGAIAIVSYVVLLIASFLLQAALIRATIEDLNDRTPSFGECLATGLRSLLPIIGISILTGIGVMLGLILLVVPGIIVWLMWSVAVPAHIEEGTGVGESLSRSSALTKGSRLPIFGLFLIVIVLGLIIQTLLAVVFAALGPIVGTIGAALISTVNSAIVTTAIATTYVELRMAKEGATASSLAAIFR